MNVANVSATLFAFIFQQFEKIEQFVLCDPEKSWEMFDEVKQPACVHRATGRLLTLTDDRERRGVLQVSRAAVPGYRYVSPTCASLVPRTFC